MGDHPPSLLPQYCEVVLICELGEPTGSSGGHLLMQVDNEEWVALVEDKLPVSRLTLLHAPRLE